MEIFLWSVGIDGAPINGMQEDVLSAPERARAAGYRFGRDRRRFVASRAFLRYVLGQHLGLSPAGAPIVASSGRKPTVDVGAESPRLAFSLSRSGALAVIAVTRGHEVGVDLEQVQAGLDIDGLAESVFSVRELTAWRRSMVHSRRQAFFRAWTRKEALGKAEGSGIAAGPNSIEVPLTPLAAGQCLSVAGRRPGSRWLISDIPGVAGVGQFAGCLVVGVGDVGAGTARYRDQAVQDRVNEHAAGRLLTVPAGARLIVRHFDLTGRDASES